jgi:hypothetical protein
MRVVYAFNAQEDLKLVDNDDVLNRIPEINTYFIRRPLPSMNYGDRVSFFEDDEEGILIFNGSRLVKEFEKNDGKNLFEDLREESSITKATEKNDDDAITDQIYQSLEDNEPIKDKFSEKHLTQALNGMFFILDINEDCPTKYALHDSDAKTFVHIRLLIEAGAKVSDLGRKILTFEFQRSLAIVSVFALDF